MTPTLGKAPRKSQPAPARAPAAALPDLSLQLAANFTLKELVRSATAERDEPLKLEQEHPPQEVVDNLAYLARVALQPIRSGIAAPVHVTSGYRCPTVNKLVGGSGRSQHVLGEAADCELSPSFLTDPGSEATREEVRAALRRVLGKAPRPDLDQNGYLFAYVCLHLDDLDVDQVIHEYGDAFGRPAWVHVSASRRQDKRQILFIGSYTGGHYVAAGSVKEALSNCAG